MLLFFKEILFYRKRVSLMFFGYVDQELQHLAVMQPEIAFFTLGK